MELADACFGCFADLRRFFERLVFAANRLHPVRRPRLLRLSRDALCDEPSRSDELIVSGLIKIDIETPPRATREKPGKCTRVDPAIVPGNLRSRGTSRDWPSFATSRAPGQRGQASS